MVWVRREAVAAMGYCGGLTRLDLLMNTANTNAFYRLRYPSILGTR